MERKKFILGFLTGFCILSLVTFMFLYFQTHGANLNLSDFNMKTLNGKTVITANQTNQPTVVNVWGTWCSPCIAEFPAFVKAKSKFKNVKFYFLTDEKAATILKFNSKRKLDFDFVTTTQNLANIGINIRPVTYFFDIKGQLYHRIDGDTTEEDLNKILTNLQKGIPLK